MAIKLRHQALSVLVLLSLVPACGGDDDKKQPIIVEVGEAGAPAFPPTYPPALGPEDCAKTTSAVTLSQPEGADVWGGLVLLDFTVEGAKVSSFDLQAFDPALMAWSNNYLSQSNGQHEDGSYFMAVTPYFSDANKDKELKLRIRPSQQGCPEADWTETDTFSAGDPLLGTRWQAQVPATIFSGQFSLQRTAIPNDMALPEVPVVLGAATLSLEFGKKGVFTESVSVPLGSEPDAPLNGCKLNLTFTGTYQLIVRQQYGGLMLAISEQTLTDFAATKCAFPKVEEMALAAKDSMLKISAYTRQGVSINYMPTLYAEPGAPIWEDGGFGQVFQQLPQFLNYVTPTEMGTVNGYVYPQDLSFERQ